MNNHNSMSTTGIRPNQSLVLLGILQDNFPAGGSNEKIQAIVNKFMRNNRFVQIEGRFFKPRVIQMVRNVENPYKCVFHILGREVIPSVNDVLDDELQNLVIQMNRLSIVSNHDMSLD